MCSNTCLSNLPNLYWIIARLHGRAYPVILAPSLMGSMLYMFERHKSQNFFALIIQSQNRMGAIFR